MTEVVGVTVPNKLRFRLALRRSARLSYVSGKITKDQYDNVLDVLRNSVRKAKETGQDIDLVDEIMEDVYHNAVDSGVVEVGTPLESINWEGLLAFLQKLMPIILEFIKAFMLLV